MSGSVFTNQYFSPQVLPNSALATYQQALAAARQRAAVQQSYMQQMQQQAAKQQQAMLQTSAVPGPAASPIPSQTPMPGATPIAGGGQVPLTAQGVQGAVPMSQNGVPAPGPQQFRAAPGGPNASGGANPFQMQRGGNQGQINQALSAYIQQQNNPFGLPNPNGTPSQATDIGTVLSQMTQLGGLSLFS